MVYKKCFSIDCTGKHFQQLECQHVLQVSDGEVHSSSIETDLKIEKEWRQSLQETVILDREAKAELQQQIGELLKLREVSSVAQ